MQLRGKGLNSRLWEKRNRSRLVCRRLQCHFESGVVRFFCRGRKLRTSTVGSFDGPRVPRLFLVFHAKKMVVRPCTNRGGLNSQT